MPLAQFLGDVAQLGERCLRKAEAEGSNPFISTKLSGPSGGWVFFYDYETEVAWN